MRRTCVFESEGKKKFTNIRKMSEVGNEIFVPFEILEKIGLVAYMLAFLASMRVHNLFYVSLLKKYVPDHNHIIYWNVIWVEQEGYFRVEPVCILD
jgi:hypothetical protein